MKIFPFAALAVVFALVAGACQPDGYGAGLDSPPVEVEPTVAPRQTTTTTIERPDVSISVPSRLLIDGSDIGTQYRTAVLKNEDVWELDETVELDDSGEAVNLSFSVPVEGVCESRSFTGLRFDPGSGLLYPSLVSEESETCRVVDVHTIVVSVDREDLPREFILSVANSVPPEGLAGQIEIGIGQLGIAPNDPLVLTDDNDLARGDVRYVAFNAHCGVEQIGYLINGNYWQLTGGPGGGDYVPSEWRPFVDGETIMLELTVSSPEVLIVSPSGRGLELVYAPITEAELTGCI